MYVLYDLATGSNHSQSEESFVNPDDSVWGIKHTDKTGIWNPVTLDFDPRPSDKKMTTLAFMELFTDAELVGILDAAKVSTLVELFVLKMKQADFIDLDYQPTIDGINSLSASGLITAQRALEILNGYL